MLNRTIAPASKGLEKYEIIRAKTVNLDNGLKLHQIIAGTQPIIRLEIIFYAGSWHEKQNGAAFFTSKMLSEGTKDLSGKAIEEKIAFYGAFLELESGPDRSSIVLYCLSKHLNTLLPIISSIAKSPIFPVEELDNLKNITAQNLSVNLNKTSFLASVNFKELLFGPNHPYGRYLAEESISKITRESILDHYNNFYSYSNCEIILSGYGKEDFPGIINEFFGKDRWGSGGQAKAIHQKESITQKEFLIDKKDSLQSSIRLGTPLFNVGHPDYLKTYILIEIFGGYFGSRLMKNIREEKGFTYGIHANHVSLNKEGYLVIGTDVKKEYTKQTIDEVFKEIEILKTELVKEDELNSVKNYLLGTFINSLNTPFALADKFKTIYFNDLSYSFYDTYIEAIKTVSAQEILDLANKYLVRDKFIEVVVGGK